MSKTSRVRKLVTSAKATASRNIGADPSRPACAGRIVDWTAAGVVVDYEGNPRGPVVARSLVAWVPEQLQRAVAEHREVLLAFEQDDPLRPVILGQFAEVPKPVVEAPIPTSKPVLEATVDGKRVELSAEDEVVLRCGEASITLRRNGRVLIRGAYVETRARGTNRIKGGNVLIN